MNWVGGARSRIKQSDRKQQQEYFEHKRYAGKLARKAQRVSSPPMVVKHHRMVSQDLLSLKTLSEAHDIEKKAQDSGVTRSVREHAFRFERKGVTVARRQRDLELPMSPIANPSLLELLDTSSSQSMCLEAPRASNENQSSLLSRQSQEYEVPQLPNLDAAVLMGSSSTLTESLFPLTTNKQISKNSLFSSYGNSLPLLNSSALKNQSSHNSSLDTERPLLSSLAGHRSPAKRPLLPSLAEHRSPAKRPLLSSLAEHRSPAKRSLLSSLAEHRSPAKRLHIWDSMEWYSSEGNQPVVEKNKPTTGGHQNEIQTLTLFHKSEHPLGSTAPPKHNYALPDALRTTTGRPKIDTRRSIDSYLDEDPIAHHYELQFASTSTLSEAPLKRPHDAPARRPSLPLELCGYSTLQRCPEGITPLNPEHIKALPASTGSSPSVKQGDSGLSAFEVMMSNLESNSVLDCRQCSPQLKDENNIPDVGNGGRHVEWMKFVSCYENKRELVEERVSPGSPSPVAIVPNITKTQKSPSFQKSQFTVKALPHKMVTDGACPQVRELDIFLSQDEVMFTQIPQPIMKGLSSPGTEGLIKCHSTTVTENEQCFSAPALTSPPVQPDPHAPPTPSCQPAPFTSPAAPLPPSIPPVQHAISAPLVQSGPSSPAQPAPHAPPTPSVKPASSTPPPLLHPIPPVQLALSASPVQSGPSFSTVQPALPTLNVQPAHTSVYSADDQTKSTSSTERAAQTVNTSHKCVAVQTEQYPADTRDTNISSDKKMDSMCYSPAVIMEQQDQDNQDSSVMTMGSRASVLIMSCNAAITKSLCGQSEQGMSTVLQKELAKLRRGLDDIENVLVWRSLMCRLYDVDNQM